MSIRSINPYNGEILKSFDEHSDHDIENKINLSHKAFLSWHKTTTDFRATLMNRCAFVLLENKEKYAEIITREMGKIIRESISEVEKCASACQYYAEHASQFLDDEPLKTSKGKAFIHYNALGPVLAIMPWNFPFWQVFRFAAPGLMAGNTAILKHASNVPQCALTIEEIFNKAGFPEGVFQSLLINTSKVSQIIDHPRIQGVTLTGSEYAGSKVAERAGKNIKKTVLELGGSDPFIVLEDADLDLAVQIAVKARMINCGQSCIAAKRFIIQKPIADQFMNGFIAELKKLKKGDPMDANTDFASLARNDLANDIHQQVKKSLDLGATLRYGELPQSIQDAHFPPLVLENVKPGMPAYEEEIFGPVASFFVFDKDQEAVSIANDSLFGLGGSLWTSDIQKAKFLADQIESGAIYINQMMFSDPSVPFGGIKHSGFGRELSQLGIREFTNMKTVWIA